MQSHPLFLNKKYIKSYKGSKSLSLIAKSKLQIHSFTFDF